MKKILVIEDDKNIRENIRLLLELKEYEVFEAGNAEKGIEMALSVNPDVIISDIMLPGNDGYYIKQILDEHEKIMKIPFIFLSAKSSSADVRKGMNLGADDYITKPFKSKELLEAIAIRINRFDQVRGTNKSVYKRKLSYKDKILVQSGKNPVFINISSIVYITAKREYSIIITDDERKFLIRKLLKDWEQELPSSDFLRIHRSHIVNLNFIKTIFKSDHRNYQLNLKSSNSIISISQRYAVRIKKIMGI